MPQSRFASQSRVALPGSERSAFSEGEVPPALLAHSVAATGDYAPQESITVSVIAKRREPIDADSVAEGAHRVSREAFEARHGADPASIQLIHDFAAEFDLTVDEKNPVIGTGYRTVHLTASREAIEKAFGVKLSDRETEQGKLRVRQGSICIPEELVGHIDAVLGLDNRPIAKPHCRSAKPNATGTSYTPVQVGQLYGFPAGAKAAGQTIGIIELGGGFRPADITAYFQGLGLPVPTVTAVSVDKGKNKPGKASGADGEVMLDIEVCAAVAVDAKIVVYFAPNTDQGFIDAISTAVHDATHKPSVISISWGGPESSWSTQSLNALDAACQSAAALGITITAAAGDNGSTDGVTGTANHVDFPASSPHVLACGGTRLTGSGATIASEVVWNETAANEGATGGGVSAYFAKPAWQSTANVPKPVGTTGGRGVPDVAGDADPTTGYQVRVDGGNYVIGGTSAVAPLWAGLVALANAANKHNAGFVNPVLYKAPASFHDITQGNNGAFSATSGWDACTGLGSPIGSAIIKALAPAGSGTSA